MNIKLEDKRFCTECLQAFPDFNLLLISSIAAFYLLFKKHEEVNLFRRFRKTVVRIKPAEKRSI
jgi:hypothetical protein